jgi:hypothetical protein
MKYRLKSVLAICTSLVMSSAFGAASPYSPIQPLDLSSWHKVATGVYDSVQADGSTVRISFGAAGAEYDRAFLNQSATNALSAAATTTDVNEANALLDEADSYARAASKIPMESKATVVPLVTQSGSLCSGAYNYYFDSNLGVGLLGATAVARARVMPEQFVPPPPPTSSSVYNSATVTPVVGSAVTSTGTGTYSTIVPNAVADWSAAANMIPIGTGSCTASTFSSISLSGGACTSPAYVSLSKSYSSCQ